MRTNQPAKEAFARLELESQSAYWRKSPLTWLKHEEFDKIANSASAPIFNHTRNTRAFNYKGVTFLQMPKSNVL